MTTKEIFDIKNIDVDDNQQQQQQQQNNDNNTGDADDDVYDFDVDENFATNNDKNNYNSMYNVIKPRQSIRNRRNQRFNQQFNYNNKSTTETNSKSYDDSLNSIEFIEELKRRSNYNHSGGGGILNSLYSIYMWLIQTITWIQRSIIQYLHYCHITIRLAIYLLMIIIAGSIKDYVGLDPPDQDVSILPLSILNFIHRYLRSSKRSFLNVYFVKLGWFWTLIETIPFILITRLMITIRRRKSEHNDNNCKLIKMKNYNTIKSSTGGDEIAQQQQQQQQNDVDHNQHQTQPSIIIKSFFHDYLDELTGPLIRLSLATIVWYFSVESFVYIGKLTGHCQSNDKLLVYLHTTIDDCRRQGNRWIHGLDISGHIFLMTFSNLICIEELRYLFYRFEEFHEFHRYIKFNRERTENFIEPYRFRWNSSIHWLGLILTLIITIITLIWDYMMLQTMFFYHNLIQKILGFLWAIIMWFIIYKIITGWIFKPLNIEFERKR
ncbi:fat storage-inducing transmembrane protein 2 [Dermatophagoides pteronyssinus]|uniref:Fat storage-inducing transmembrane protein 2 n=1 Tax=Dermatophagoides pteronyssinus TaxID=6956 RepID=A0ABQ8JFD8_DERPT|nr:fat storage-inducing transmembrane protein 2 [Dermatophagoides pteronyssinus]